MTTLTLDLLRANPWNVVLHPLPDHPDAVLLDFALLAADYCRMSERLVVGAAHLGLYAPPSWATVEDPDERWSDLEQSGEIAHDAYRRVHETWGRINQREQG